MNGGSFLGVVGRDVRWFWCLVVMCAGGGGVWRV